LYNNCQNPNYENYRYCHHHCNHQHNNQIRCKARKCTIIHATHYCRICYATDSNHRARDCPQNAQQIGGPRVVQTLATPAYARAAQQIGVSDVEAMILQRGVMPGQAYSITGPRGVVIGVAPNQATLGVMRPRSGLRPAPTNLTLNSFW
jgi:hypothetical protein